MADSHSILCISDIIPGDMEGGSGRVAWELGRGLIRRGHRIAVLTRGDKRQPGQEVIDGIAVSRFYSNPMRGRRVFRELVKTFRPDLLIIHQPLSGISAIPLRGRLKIPMVYVFHSPWPEEYRIRRRDLPKSFLREGMGTFLRKRLERKLLGMAGSIVTLSEFMATRLRHWHEVHADKITVIPGGVDLERFNVRGSRERARLQLDLPRDRFLVLTVRNLVSRMGLESLVLAMRSVVEARPNALLLIGGKGYLEKKLAALIEEFGLQNNIRLAGYIKEKDLAAYYRAADLFVLPTRALEGFGLVTLEAMACGTPVLGTPVGGTVEILGRFDDRFLLPGCDMEAIAAGVKDFMERGENPGVLEGKCRSFVEKNYSWDRFAERVDKLAENLQKGDR
jgi:glycosyltransferase involved in cell wall biosynthesis